MISDATKPEAVHHVLEAASAFQAALVTWFRQVGRTYPWRETQDPYAILVSEMMLQQTQIATVLDRGYYERWLEAFPTVEALAKAPEDAVLKAWEGLGYYRRARSLHQLAIVVCAEHDGRLPETLEGMLALPGVGRYTAGAVLSFAHDLSVPLVDGNVHRVFARLFDFRQEVDRPAGQKQLWAWAEALVPKDGARAYNSGLMELGQTICAQKQPDCPACPVRDFCQTRDPVALPVKTKRKATEFVEEHVWWCLREGKLRLVQETGKRRKGLWKLPECGEADSRGSLLYKAKYSITHYRVTLHVHACEETLTEGQWHPLASIPALAMPAPYRKAVQQLLAESKEFKLTHT